MVDRLLISLLTLALTGFLATYSVSAAPPDGEKCVFPEDCLRHTYCGINIGWGTCECSSAWRERFIHATREKRLQLWKERGKPMCDRILAAYRLSEAQNETCNRIREEFWADWRRQMGKERFEEARDLRGGAIDRLGEHIHARRQVKEDAPGAEEALAKLPRVQDDPVLQSGMLRLSEIEREHPIDWSDLADRIEDALPQEQAKRGRQRLGERFPYSVSSNHGEKLGTGKRSTGAAAGDIDRWGAYVRAFTVRYQLTTGQSNAAESILKEVRARAAQLTHATRDDTARVQARGHQEEAQRRRELLQFDLDDLFEVFKARLDGLLTKAQQQVSTTP